MKAQMSWATYWQSGAQHSLDASRSAVLQGFMSEYFFSRVQATESILDLATGNGAVLAGLPAVHHGVSVGVDFSAIKPNEKLLERHRFLQMDGACLGFADASFDWVVSQFGFEYLPTQAALQEMLRVLKGPSQVLLLCHRRNSLLCQNSAKQLQEAERLMRSDVFNRFEQCIEQNFGPKTPAAELYQCLNQLQSEALLPQSLSLLSPCLQAIAQLHKDCVNGAFEPAQAQRAIDNIQVLLNANAKRLEQQLAAAMDGAEQKALSRFMREQGFKAKTVALNEQGRPLAWGLYFQRDLS